MSHRQLRAHMEARSSGTVGVLASGNLLWMESSRGSLRSAAPLARTASHRCSLRYKGICLQRVVAHCMSVWATASGMWWRELCTIGHSSLEAQAKVPPRDVCQGARGEDVCGVVSAKSMKNSNFLFFLLK